jgi:hypothetical protein
MTSCKYMALGTPRWAHNVRVVEAEHFCTQARDEREMSSHAETLVMSGS